VTESAGNPRNDPGPPPQLWPQEFEPVASLSSSVAELLGAAEKVYPAQLPPQPRRIRRDAESNGEAVTAVADPRADLWSHAAHLISVLDQRMQAVQHQLAELHRAYRSLLAQLYPPSEVYVVAVAPGGEDEK
jgi:hypothetical protein